MGHPPAWHLQLVVQAGILQPPPWHLQFDWHEVILQPPESECKMNGNNQTNVRCYSTIHVQKSSNVEIETIGYQDVPTWHLLFWFSNQMQEEMMSKYNFTGTWMMMLRRQRVYHNISILPIMCARANVALERPDHLCIVCNYQRRCVSVVSHMHVWHVSHHLKKKNNLHSRPNRARLRCIHVGKKIGLGRIFLLRIFHRGSE